MATRAGVGFSNSSDTASAAKEALKNALASGVKNPDAVMLFSTSKHPSQALVDAVRAEVGPKARIFGGQTLGIITNDKVSYFGSEVGVAVVESDQMKFQSCVSPGVDTDEEKAGRALGEQIQKAGGGEASMFLMFDAIKKTLESGAPQFNFATPFLKGMRESLHGKWPKTIGFSSVGDIKFTPGFQWANDKVAQKTASALVISGAHVETGITHSCRPSSDYKTITKSDGPWVLELDGRPALDVVGELVGPETMEKVSDYPFFITFGINLGDKFGDFNEQDYVNRPCAAVDKSRKALMFYEPLAEGTEIQLVRRVVKKENLEGLAKDLLAKTAAQGKKPVLAVYVECVGRTKDFAGTEKDDALGLQEVLGNKIPLLGVIGPGEIAGIKSDVSSFNWTGVLAIYSV